MKNVVNPNSLFIMLEIDRKRKSPDEDSSKSVEANWMVIGKFADSCIRVIKAPEKFLSQARSLPLIPSICIGSIKHCL
jgi:hypothetical protein